MYCHLVVLLPYFCALLAALRIFAVAAPAISEHLSCAAFTIKDLILSCGRPVDLIHGGISTTVYSNWKEEHHLNMYICICIYVYSCMCVCVYIYIYVYVWVCICVYIYIHVCMHVLVYIYMCKCICVCICEYTYAGVCVYIYMYIYR